MNAKIIQLLLSKSCIQVSLLFLFVNVNKHLALCLGSRAGRLNFFWLHWIMHLSIPVVMQA